ncbi:hypothetical protein D9757_009476 [Collybiopsis confluens]|uniref:Uncharacterized protein n=1 Tax=Collybiopsis confluens TaxID=2823264 RepID=A0A8H5H4V3_9AGAR|nr:hypothetical protein D9757_009476 [Collybiopsis confluens]
MFGVWGRGRSVVGHVWRLICEGTSSPEGTKIRILGFGQRNGMLVATELEEAVVWRIVIRDSNIVDAVTQSNLSKISANPNRLPHAHASDLKGLLRLGPL